MMDKKKRKPMGAKHPPMGTPKMKKGSMPGAPMMKMGAKKMRKKKV